MPAVDDYRKILCEICDEEGIAYKFLSKDWVMLLEYDGLVRYITGLKFDNNSHGLGLVADDKYALAEVLKFKQLPVVEHQILYPETNHFGFARGCNTFAFALDYLIAHGRDIVVKPNNGIQGLDVFHVKSEDELVAILSKMFERYSSISLCPFYHIKYEYRVVILNGGVGLSYRKTLASDGWKHNLSQGAVAEKIGDFEVQRKVEGLARKVAKAIGLKFGSVDIIETDEGFLVLEVNSSVTFEKYLQFFPEDHPKVKEIYRLAIQSLFED